MKYKHIRSIIVMFLFVIAFNYEQAVANREVIIICLFGVFLVLPYLRGRHLDKRGFSLFIDLLIINMLSYFSKFSVNYIFIILNTFVLIEAIIWQPFIVGVTLSTMTIIASGLGFYLVFQYGLNYQLLTQAIFIEAVFILVSVLLIFIKSFNSEKLNVMVLNNQLNTQNEILSETNSLLIQSKAELEHANIEIARGARLQERAHFARNLHDTVGHEVTGLIMEIEMLKMSSEHCDKKALAQELDHTAMHAREILKVMRNVVESLSESIDFTDLYDAISKRIYQFQVQSGIAVHLNYEINHLQIEPERQEVLYRSVLESLTNIGKHSNAQKVWISFLTLEDRWVLLKIHDNGSHLGHFIKGNGLNFLEERVTKYGGYVNFDMQKQGFDTVVKLPIA